MKMKAIAMLLVCLLLCGCVLPDSLNARADDAWICTSCRIWVSGNSCPQCGRLRPNVNVGQGEHLLHLKIDFKKNMFFSTYGVEVLINGQKAFLMPHGEELDAAVSVPAGKCTILLRNAADYTEDVSYVLNITEESLFACSISAHFYGLEVTDVSSNADLRTHQYGVGETGVHNGVEMTLVRVKESRGSSTCRPADGYVFVWCEFELNNPSSAFALLYPTSSIRTICDGYTVKTSARAAAEAPMGFVNCLRSGDRTRCMLCYELPSNWQTLQISYSGIGSSDDQLIFYALNP